MKLCDVAHLAPELTAQLRAGLRLLLQAWDFAESCQRSAWDFAIEIHNFRDHGLTNTDLRWLVCKGLAQHATEKTRPADKERSFHPGANLAITHETCFVLTATGLSTARQIDQNPSSPDQLLPDCGGSRDGVRTECAMAPQWDSRRRELRWARQLVKRFRLPAPNQEVILAAFEEEGWPPRIDDPLSNQPDQDPKQRLHDTIKNLNRHQVHRLLVFEGDGTGEGVQWRQVDLSSSTEVP
jgi:hypothetical protein